MDGLIEKLEEHHREEMHDVEEYTELMNEFKEHGFDREAMVLKDLAYEEGTHANILNEMITCMKLHESKETE